MKHKTLWKIIPNKGDCTFYADDFEVAATVCILISGGRFGIVECGAESPRMWPVIDGATEGMVAQYFSDNFGCTMLESADRIRANKTDEVLSALRSVALASPQQREMYDKAMLDLDNENMRIKYLREWNAIHKSGISPVMSVVADLIAAFEGRIARG